MLKIVRFTLAGFCLISFCLLFFDPVGILFPGLSVLTDLQIVPALLSGGVAVFVMLLGLTLVFGRVYCSVLCPLGLLQDAICRFWKKRRFKFSRPNTGLRIIMFQIFVIGFMSGIPLVLGVLEPYSAFGRIAANVAMLLRQAAGLLPGGCSSPLWPKGEAPLATSLLLLIIICIMTLRAGRAWCNTLCPVGGVLGFLSRFSLFQIRINQEKCVKCGLCGSSCKASCIDTKEGALDSSRCVACFNCIDQCRHKAITYLPIWKRQETEVITRPSDGKRNFMMVALGLSVLSIFDRSTSGRTDSLLSNTFNVITPPGSGSLSHFQQNCTGCQLCVSACPNHVLISSDKGFGMLQPSVSYKYGHCKMDCVACSNVCPTGAIGMIRQEERKTIQVGTAIVDWERCLVNTDKKECRICSDACPTKAASLIGAPGMSKWLAVMPEYCIGCGACEHSCPVSPTAAIHVMGNIEHRRIKKIWLCSL